MSAATLAAGFLLNTLAAAVFAFVGLRFSTSTGAREARMAGRMFVCWWWGFGGFMFLWIALPMGLVLVGITDLSLYMGLLYAAMFSLCMGIGCLVVYLLYLLVGRRWHVVPVLVYYFALSVMFAVLFTIRDPVDVAVGDWWVDLVYATPLTTPFHVLTASLILPTTFVALWYFTLVGRTSDLMMRVRITVVAWSLVVWGLAGMLARVFEADELQFVARTGLGLLAALLILVVYESPRWLQSRIEAVSGHEAKTHRRTRGNTQGRTSRSGSRQDLSPRERRRERESELLWRMDELI